MALEQRLNLRMSQRLIMTPSLQQAIKLLQLSKLDLINEINQELEQNPVLEEGLETMAPQQLNSQPTDQTREPDGRTTEHGTGDEDDYEAFWRDYLDKGYEPRGPIETLETPSFEATLTRQENLETMAPEQLNSQPTDQTREPDGRTTEHGTGDEDDYEAFWRDYLDKGYEPRGPIETLETPSFEATLTRQENLTDHLNWQLEMSSVDDRSREIAQAIIGNLNDSGYLDASIGELQTMGRQGAAQGGNDTGDEYTVAEVERVLLLVKGFDPPGVAARNLSECLLLQLRHLGVRDILTEQIVRDHIDLLQSHKYQEIATRVGCSLEQVQAQLEIIRHLDPSPGLKYNMERSQYVTPDVYVLKDDQGEYRVVLNEDGLPRLRISQTYRKMIERGNQTTDREAREFVKDKVRSAVHLIKSLDERKRTIMKVAVSLVKHQRDFLDHGIESIRPLRLRDVADDIEMHESTVSRVVRNKYMYTPRGLFEMRYFFHASVSDDRGGEVSALSVKEKIKQIVEAESGMDPLSDSAIVKILEATHGVKVARRTVAKYRGELRIGSSTDRKVPFA